MGANASVITPPLPVQPGEQVECQLTVRNDGTVVDSFTVEPLGTPAAWATVEPAELPLLPGEDGTFTVRFAPPRTPGATAGGHPFGLRVVSREDPDGNIVEEGWLEVGPFTDTGAELLPRTSRARGRRWGKHEIALDNRGNVSALITLQPLDPDDKLEARVAAPGIDVGPGRTEIVRLDVRARERFWRGPAVTLPFQVHVEPPGTAPIELDGNLLQSPVVPKWMARALLLLVVVAALLAGMWLTVLRPTIEDSARSAAAAEAAKAAKVAKKQAAATAAEQQDQIDALAEQVDAAGNPATGAKPAAVPKKPRRPVATTIDPLGDPIATRLAVTSTEQAPALVLSKDKIVSVTDVLLQNPAGDSGLLTVTRNRDPLYVTRLENFRDLDLHFVAQLTFQPGDKLGLTVDCENRGARARPCTPALTVSGFARKAR